MLDVQAFYGHIPKQCKIRKPPKLKFSYTYIEHPNLAHRTTNMCLLLSQQTQRPFTTISLSQKKVQEKSRKALTMSDRGTKMGVDESWQSRMVTFNNLD